MQEDAPVILGPFRLDTPIGEGGMGVVYRGEHRRDGRTVAVKVMTAEAARRDEIQTDFRREVQALAKLHHPAIARVVDYGVVEGDSGRAATEGIAAGAPWFAMEFVEGDPIQEAAREWRWERIEQFLLLMLDALAHAHANEVVHRDLKPANILITDADGPEVEATLVDFGIAHIFDSGDDGGVERAPETWGTPEVMAPEQIRGEWREQGPWTDLYALGCVAWWMVCRSAPFTGEERREIYLQHISGSTGPFEPAFEVPDGLERWMRRMLAIDRRERFQRAADAAYALVRTSQPVERSPAGGAVERPAPGGPGPEDLLDVAPPPIPNHWERAEPSFDRPAPDAGQELFDLRKIPLVDRRRERDQLWRALQTVQQTQQPVARLLRGPAGSGKSRLADWVARRGHELGALTVMRATHSPKGGPRDGLGPMLARQFRCTDLDWSEGFERVRNICESLGIDRSTGYHDAVGLARMMGLDEENEAPPPGFQNPREKHLALRRLLVNAATRRPVLLWLDDVAWGWESARFAEYLLRESVDEPLPVYVVMTARDTTIEERPQVGRMLETICDHEFGDDIPVRPLDEAAHRELVERLLHFDDALVDEIVERTEGHPLFAIQLVGDWVERGVLTGGPEGFVLREDAEHPIPDGPHELWRRRIEHVSSALPETERADGQKAMELAAALGRHVDADEWRAVCERAGVSAEDRLVESLVEYGLARRKPNGWSFIHSMLAESLEREARDAGRWAEWHLLCAETIRDEMTDRGPETAGRRAAHYVEAEAYERALEPLLEAARRARRLGRHREQRKYLDRRAEMLDRIGAGEDDRRRARNWFERAMLSRETGADDRTRELLERTQEAAWEHEWPRVLGDVLRLDAQLARDEGAIDKCLELAEAAEEPFRETNSSLGRARCQMTRAGALMSRGDYSEARAAFRLAKSLFDAHGRPSDVLRAEDGIIYTYIYEGAYETSRERARDALERARELGDKSTEAEVWNQLGECARFEREWGEARRYYERAAREYEQIGHRGKVIAELNMAMVEISAGRYDRARREFGAVSDRLEEVGLQSRLPRIELGLLAAAAGRGDWSAFDDHWADVADRFPPDQGATADEAWLMEQAARIADEREAEDRARRLYRLAAETWKGLGATERVERLEERFEAPDGS